MPEIFDTYHPISNIIFQLIDGGLKVLDVRYGTGRLSEKLRLEKNCYVVDVEKDE